MIGIAASPSWLPSSRKTWSSGAQKSEMLPCCSFRPTFRCKAMPRYEQILRRRAPCRIGVIRCVMCERGRPWAHRGSLRSVKSGGVGRGSVRHSWRLLWWPSCIVALCGALCGRYILWQGTFWHKSTSTSCFATQNRLRPFQCFWHAWQRSSCSTAP